MAGNAWIMADVIDWGRVAELREDFGEDGFAEVADLFLVEVEEAVAALPGEDLAGALHFIKGCALNLGFVELAAICTGAGGPETPAQVAASFAAAKAAFSAAAPS